MSSSDHDNEQFQGLLYALFATFGWALTGVLIRLLEIQSSSMIIFGRLVVATIILLPFVIRDKKALFQAFQTPIALLMALYYIFATEAFVRSTIAEVVLIVGLTPLIVMLLGRFYGEKISRPAVIGAVITVLGLAAFLVPSLGAIGSQRVTGNLFAFAAAIVSAIFAFGLRRRTVQNRPIKILSLTFVTFCYGIMLGGGMVYVNDPSFSINLSMNDIYLLCALGFVSTAIPTLFFGIAATKLSSVTTASLTLLTPIWAALIGGIVISEWPAPLSVPGALITLAGLWVIIRQK